MASLPRNDENLSACAVTNATPLAFGKIRRSYHRWWPRTCWGTRAIDDLNGWSRSRGWAHVVSHISLCWLPSYATSSFMRHYTLGTISGKDKEGETTFSSKQRFKLRDDVENRIWEVLQKASQCLKLNYQQPKRFPRKYYCSSTWNLQTAPVLFLFHPYYKSWWILWKMLPSAHKFFAQFPSRSRGRADWVSKRKNCLEGASFNLKPCASSLGLSSGVERLKNQRHLTQQKLRSNELQRHRLVEGTWPGKSLIWSS